MKIFKPFNFSLLYKVFEARQSFFFCGAMICMFPFQQPNRLFADPKIWKFAGQELGKDAALDWVMPKPVGEVLVTGSCYSGKKKLPARKVHLRIGSIDKSLLVFGDRHWVKRANLAVNISDPEPFDRMPICYEKAFGGQGFPKNPLGKGACVLCDAQGREVQPLPNIETPKPLIGSPDDRPEPAGLGPLDMTWPQRMSRAGTYDDKWLQELFPGLAADIDMHFFNLAPKDQWLEGYFNGDEHFALEGMHPEREMLVSRLPGFKTRLFIERQENDQSVFEEIKTSLDTVWLFPHAEQGILIYHGVTEIGSDDARDVQYCLGACERLQDAPRPLEHYQEALTRRLDKDKSMFYELYDQDLIPPGEISGWADLIKIDPENKGPLAANMERRALKEKEKALGIRAKAEASVKEMLAASGVDPSTVQLPPLPNQEEDGELSQLKSFDPELLAKKVRETKEKAEQMTAQAQKEAEQKLKEGKAWLKKACAEQGLDFEKIMAEMEAQKPKRPIQYAADLRAQIKETQESLDQQVQAAGIGAQDSPFQETMEQVKALDPDDPELIQKLEQVEQETRKAYQNFGHMYPPPKALSPDEAEQVKVRFEEIREKGGSFRDVDLAGIDLSGLDLSGMNLSGAFLEGANLSGANLSEANLTGAVLSYADLSGIIAKKTKLVRTNLGKSRLTRAEFSQANLKDAVLSEADLEETRFTHCKMTELQLLDTTFKGTDFSFSDLEEALFINPILEGVSFKGAKLVDAVMLNPRMNRVDCSEMNAQSATFVGLKSEATRFDHADLTKAAFLKNAQLPGSNFQYAVLDNANFMGANLQETSLAKASMKDINFLEADLKKADLTGALAQGGLFTKADLENSKIMGANLKGASLRGARLVGADLRLANLYSAEVFRAVFGKTRLKGANLKMTKIRNWEQRPQE